MNDLVVLPDEQLFSGAETTEANFNALSLLGQIKVLRGTIEYIVSSLPVFMKVTLGDPHEHCDEGLRAFDAVAVLGPDVTWADLVHPLLPLGLGNSIGQHSEDTHTERGILLRSDGCLLLVSRTSSVRGALICNDDPSEIRVIVVNNDQLMEAIASDESVKSLLRKVICMYRGYLVDEFGRADRTIKLADFCGVLVLLVDREILD